MSQTTALINNKKVKEERYVSGWRGSKPKVRRQRHGKTKGKEKKKPES